jgi:predicted dehydrogenase
MKTIKRREFIKTGAIITAGIPLGLNAMQWGKRSSNKPITIGVIGTGDRGAYEAYILKETPGIEVVACCDIIPKHLENGLMEAGGKSKGYTDYKKLLKHRKLDAVLICTPQHLHYQMALDAIAAKKHIICQKTLTLTTSDALALSKAVKKTDRVFQVAYQWQSSPLFNKVHQMISAV